MSLEKTLAENTAMIHTLIHALASLAGKTTSAAKPTTGETAPMAGAEKTTTAKAATNKTPKTTAKDKGAGGPVGKDQSNLKDEAMAKLKQVMSEKGKEALAGVLSRFGCKKFSDIGNDQYKDLIEIAEKTLLEKEVIETGGDDLLGDSPRPEVTGQVITLEDVRAQVVKVSNEPKLGMAVAREILEAHGLKKLNEITPDKFEAVHGAAVRALESLNDSGVL